MSRPKNIALSVSLVSSFFKGDHDKTMLWLNTPNPGLGDIAPMTLIEIGYEERVLNFIKLSIEEGAFNA